MADALLELISRLEDEIQDPDEETFLLYSNDIPSQGLGFIDSRASVLDLQLNGRDVTIHQSPGVLASSRKGGTTGSVLWKITPVFAEWLSSPSNILFNTILTSSSCSIIELGCGISPLNALSLSAKVSRYILTDQPYVQKLVLQNLAENKPAPSTTTKGGSRSNKKAGGSSSSSSHNKSPSPSSSSSHTAADIHFQVLDWETSQVTPSLTNSSSVSSFDALTACDCIFNYALIQPFVQTCADICKLRQSDNLSEGDKLPPCLCIVAQQLRNDDVFNSWLVAFKEHFRVWRIPGEMMPAALRPEAGFVVHIGILKDSF